MDEKKLYDAVRQAKKRQTQSRKSTDKDEVRNKKRRNNIDKEKSQLRSKMLYSETTVAPGATFKKAVETNKAKRHSATSSCEAKREKERLKKQKQREKIRQNPEAHEKAKEKERERYINRKSQGKLVSIKNKTPREQRYQQKKWRQNTKNYRARKADLQKTDSFVLENSPASSVSSDSQHGHEYRVQVNKAIHLRKKINRNRTASHKKMKKLEADLCCSQRKSDMYRKRWERLQKNIASCTNGSPSPRTKVKLVLKQGHNIVRKRLLFGEAIVAQLKSNYYQMQTEKDRRSFVTSVAGNILKKYRLLNFSKEFLSGHHSRNSKEYCQNLARRSRKDSNVIEAVNKFFHSDENTCLAPGKKDCVTVRKMKKQKRYLLDTLENLHKKFLREGKFRISYTYFCRLKSFWIQQMHVSQRNTCLCIKHSNFQYLTDKLHMLKVINQRQASSVRQGLVCDTENKLCMYRQCEECMNRNLNSFSSDETKRKECFYYQWKSKKEERTNRAGKALTVQLTVKEKVVCTVEQLLQKVNEDIGPYLKHCYNAYHQATYIKELKSQLAENEAVIVIDFSENYECKLYEEVQAAHFGASKNQVTLHTGVIYMRSGDQSKALTDTDYQEIQCNSFVSLSSSLRHNASAIWAHLKPVLDNLTKQFPDLKVVHFQSDGPMTQYRNKCNFFLLNYFMKKYSFQHATWNFTEAGHGKSSADGIGGTIKSLADRAVAKGRDIANASMLFTYLREAETKVTIFKITETDIMDIDKILPIDLKPVKNTMAVHQLVWDSSSPNQLELRYLSCLKCFSNCSHYQLNPAICSYNETIAAVSVPELDNSVAANHSTSNTMAKCRGNEWVAVVYDNLWYPGHVEATTDSILTVNFMARAQGRGRKFYWPTKKDKQYVSNNEILCHIHDPPIPVCNRYFVISPSEQTAIDKLFLELFQ